MKRENKDIPDHNMSLSFLFKMIEKEGRMRGMRMAQPRAGKAPRVDR